MLYYNTDINSYLDVLLSIIYQLSMILEESFCDLKDRCYYYIDISILVCEWLALVDRFQSYRIDNRMNYYSIIDLSNLVNYITSLLVVNSLNT